MARIVENDKGFKVIALSHMEAFDLGWGIWRENDEFFFLCMNCNTPIRGELYYVAALNDVMDKECYDKWYSHATPYSDDKPIEDNNFNRVWGKIQAWHRAYDVESIFGQD